MEYSLGSNKCYNYGNENIPEATSMPELIKTPHDIGRALHDLRKAKHITGGELAKQAGISQSKMSKIETAAIQATPTELELLLNILDCPKIIRQQILAVHEVDSLTFEPKYRSIDSPTLAVYKREANTHTLRCFTFNLLPVLLQTGAYMEGIFSRIELSSKEVAQRTAENMKRQDLLWDSRRSNHLIMHEAALYTLLGKRQMQLEQLDRLERVSSLKHVRVGIIPLEAGLPVTENSNFVLYDANLVVLIVANREFLSSDPQDIAEHLKVFGKLEQLACYGSEATALVAKAMRFFAS